MNTQLRVLIPALVVLMAVALLLNAAPARANYPYTIGGESIRNATPTDTLPFSPGQMSVRWNNVAGGDTRYADSDVEISTEVDTGYDIWNIGSDASGGNIELGFRSDSWTVAGATSTSGDSTDTGTGNITPGDTIVHAFNIHNRSNNPAPIPFKVSHLVEEAGLATHDSFVLELFWEAGDSTADQFDSATAQRLDNSGAEIDFTYDQVKTLFAVITPKAVAGDGDSVTTRFFVSNQAPSSSGDSTAAGDQWQNGRPIARADENDTQVYWMVTEIQGPVLQISKSLVSLSEQYGEAGQFRPGDTIQFTIAVDNTGGDTAYGVNVADAIPDSTTYVPGSATGAAGEDVQEVNFSDDVTSADFPVAEDADTTDVEKIQWVLEDIGAGATRQVEFEVTID